MVSCFYQWVWTQRRSRNCFFGLAQTDGQWLTMQWRWVVELEFHGAKLSHWQLLSCRQLMRWPATWAAVSPAADSCLLAAAGWSFLLAGRAICQARASPSHTETRESSIIISAQPLGCQNVESARDSHQHYYPNTASALAAHTLSQTSQWPADTKTQSFLLHCHEK